MVSRSRMPPPSSIGTCSPTAATISRMTFSFLGRPAMAPLRSTMCSRRAPCSIQWRAIFTGSSEKTVADSIFPCCSRTQRPSFKSIAGMISKWKERRLRCPVRRSGTPANEVGEQLQACGLAFFRVELYGENIIAGHRAGKGHPVDARASGDGGVRGGRKVAVDEVKAASIADPRPKGMRLLLDHLVPAHVRNLEPRERESGDAPRKDAESGCITLVAVLEKHLQTDADAEKRL